MDQYVDAYKLFQNWEDARPDSPTVYCHLSLFLRRFGDQLPLSAAECHGEQVRVTKKLLELDPAAVDGLSLDLLVTASLKGMEMSLPV